MKKVSLVIVVFLGIMLTYCTDVVNTELEEYSTENICNYLSSNQLQGRLTGTYGNEKVIEYIENFFEEIQLNTFKNESFRQAYTHKAYMTNKEQQEYKMQINFSDGASKKCIYGIDYLPTTLEEDINASITFDLEDNDMENLLVVIDSHEDFIKVYSKARGVLYKKNVFKKHLKNVLTNNKNLPTIQISEELYNILLNKKEGEIELKSNLTKTELQASNVIGIIKGQDNENALVISAHFDHVGVAGGEVFNGGLDNSSGVATILNVSKILKEYSKNNEFKNDIIICAFNGEESGLQGSRVFVDEIKDRYKRIVNINIDCIGGQNSNELNVVSLENSSDFNDDVVQYLEKEGYICYSNSLSSDHEAFKEKNMLSVSIIQNDLELIHTTKDTVEKLDYKFIDNFSKKIANYVILNEKDLFDKSYFNNKEHISSEHPQSSKYEEINKIVQEEEKKLEFNHFKNIVINGETHRIFNTTIEFDNLKEMKKYFPNINILNSVDGYTFNKATVLIDNNIEKKYKQNKEIEVNKSYIIGDLSKEKIKYIQLEYAESGENKEKLIFYILIENENNEDSVSDHFYSSDNLTFEDIEVDNHKYILSLQKNKDSIVKIKTEYKVNDKCYYLNIMKGYSNTIIIDGEEKQSLKPSWLTYSKDDIIKYIKETKLTDTIGKLVNY